MKLSGNKLIVCMSFHILGPQTPVMLAAQRLTVWSVSQFGDVVSSWSQVDYSDNQSSKLPSAGFEHLDSSLVISLCPAFSRIMVHLRPTTLVTTMT